MVAMRDQTTPHTSTVTGVSTGTVERAQRRSERRVLATRVVSRRQVDPTLWAVAMERAGGDAKRIEVVSYTEVVIR